MGFPESVLAEDEGVVLHLHPHWKTLVRPFFVTQLGVAAVVAAAVLLPAATWATYLKLAIGAVVLILFLWLALWPFMRWRTTHYVFTTHRVLLRTGILARSGRDVPLARINDVQFEHTLFERMLGCGTLTIESAGEHGQIVLKELPGVEQVQSRLYQLVEDVVDRRDNDDYPPPGGYQQQQRRQRG